MSVLTTTRNGLASRPVFHILLIAAACLFAYSNTFTVPFQFDDTPNIAENPLIQNPRYFFDPEPYCSQFRAPAIQSVVCTYFNTRSFGYLTFSVNYAVHGLDIAGYHAVNLAIHLINGILVYLLVLLTFRTPVLSRSESGSVVKTLALCSALLFVIHPVQTQAVTYIVQRFTSLATLFYLLSLVTYVKWRLERQTTEGRQTTENRGQTADIRRQTTDDRQQRTHSRLQTIEKRQRLKTVCWYATSLASAVLAMKTKEIAFTLPLLIALYEFLFFRGEFRRRILPLLPVFLTLAIIPLALIGLDKPVEGLFGDMGRSTRVLSSLSRWDYLATEFRVLVTYLRLIIFPAGQNLDYDYPVYHSFFAGPVLLSLLLLLSLAGVAVYLLYRSRSMGGSARLISFGIFWFFLTIAVESSVIPIVDVIYEHRIYLPSAGLFISVSAAVHLLMKRWGGYERIPARKALIGVLTTVLVVILAGAAYARNMVWRDKVSLWEDVTAKSPGKARGHNNLGKEYYDRGELQKAIAAFQDAVRMDPKYAQAHMNMGIAYMDLGQHQKALEEYEQTILYDPNLDEGYYNRGVLYSTVGRHEKAVADYSEAVRLNPNNSNAYNNRGNTYLVLEQYDAAIADYEHALAIDPQKVETYVNRGIACYRKGLFAKAIEDFRRACEMGNSVGCAESGRLGAL